jgi:hypothetical protein
MTKRTPAKTKVKPWGETDKYTLGELIRKGKVDIDRLDDTNYINKVLTDHFPHRDKRNFIRNFRTFSASWDTETARNGARKEDSQGKSQLLLHHIIIVHNYLIPNPTLSEQFVGRRKRRRRRR